MISDEMLAKAAAQVDQSACDGLTEKAECDHVFSDAFEKKMKRLIRHRRSSPGIWASCRVAAAFLVMVTLFGCALGICTDAQADVIYWYRLEGANGNIDYRSTTAAQGAEERRYRITWLPEGYELWDYEYRPGKWKTYVFCNGETNPMIIFDCMWQGGTGVWLSPGDQELPATVWDSPATLFMESDPHKRSVIFWFDEDGRSLLSVAACADEETLIRMAESVVKVSE